MVEADQDSERAPKRPRLGLSPQQEAELEAYFQRREREAVARAVAPRLVLAENFTPHDPVHGLMHLPQIVRAFVDHPLFQRMRHIKQLGVCSRVYPGASHDRFFHSIGTAYLGYELFKTLRSRQPELGATDRDGLCVLIAGLCHDLGHPSYSHMFEDFLHRLGRERRRASRERGVALWEEEESRVRRLERWSHEEASVMMIRQFFAELDGPLREAGLRVDEEGDDFACICELVEPPKKQLVDMVRSGTLKDRWSEVIKGRPVAKAWLYEIVSNWRTGMDADKFDYFRRDAHYLGIQRQFDHQRYMRAVRVIEYEGVATISPPQKEKESLRDMLELRKFLHRAAYQHKTVKKIEMHLIDILSQVDEHVKLTGVGGRQLSLSEAALDLDPVAYPQITDAKVETLLMEGRHSDNPGLRKAAEAFEHHITRRNLMRLIAAWSLPRLGEHGIGEPVGLPESEESVVGEVHRRYVAQPLGKGEPIAPEVPVRPVQAQEIRCCFSQLHYGMGKEDPISRVVFHNSKDETMQLFASDSESKPMREIIFVFWNPPEQPDDNATLRRLTSAFDAWSQELVDRHASKHSRCDLTPPPLAAPLAAPPSNSSSRRKLKVQQSCPVDP